MGQTDTERRLEQVYESIRDRIPFRPRVALVLGSGLGAFADETDAAAVIPYTEIEGFPVSTVAGHAGRFVFGYVEGVPCVIMQGRVHYYEGYPMQDVVLPARLMRRMGAEILFLTNASGGINAGFHAGDLMLITDHISSFVPSPLIGPNPESLGTRFPDMSHVYDPAFLALLRDTAASLEIPLQEGVYVQLTGPNYETPSEIRMLRLLGADAVGMSTVCEAMTAVHAGFRVCGISCITNLAAGISPTPLSHAEVSEAADAAAPRFKSLLRAAIARMG